MSWCSTLTWDRLISKKVQSLQDLWRIKIIFPFSYLKQKKFLMKFAVRLLLLSSKQYWKLGCRFNDSLSLIYPFSKYLLLWQICLGKQNPQWYLFWPYSSNNNNNHNSNQYIYAYQSNTCCRTDFQTRIYVLNYFLLQQP